MSGDFDPRTLWTRRQVAAAAAALTAVAATGADAFASDAEIAGRGGPAPVMVTDAAIDGAVARRMAHLTGARLAAMRAEIDPVRFWAARVAPLLTRGSPVVGVTSWADYLVLRGIAAEHVGPGGRLRVRFETGAGARAGGVEDALSARLLEAIAEAGAAAGQGRIGWILS